MRGGNVFVGYLDDPAATAAAIDAEGWLHTGDIGSGDTHGYLRILDRKKDLLVTAGGKNIAPALIEARLRSLPLVAQAFVVGDGRRYITAILALDHDGQRRGEGERERSRASFDHRCPPPRVTSAG